LPGGGEAGSDDHPATTVVITFRSPLLAKKVIVLDAAQAAESEEGIDPVYLAYYLAGAGQDELARYSTGAALPNIPTRMLRECQLPFPPIAEQRRIAARLQRELGNRDAEILTLKLALEQIPRYRSDFLKAVTAGKATPQWLANNPAKRAIEEALIPIVTNWQYLLGESGSPVRDMFSQATAMLASLQAEVASLRGDVAAAEGRLARQVDEGFGDLRQESDVTQTSTPSSDVEHVFPPNDATAETEEIVPLIRTITIKLGHECYQLVAEGVQPFVVPVEFGPFVSSQ
jgi:hypothetical protein